MSGVVKDIRQVHVYIEKQWESSEEEFKKHLKIGNSHIIVFVMVDVSNWISSHQGVSINIFYGFSFS